MQIIIKFISADFQRIQKRRIYLKHKPPNRAILQKRSALFPQLKHYALKLPRSLSLGPLAEGVPQWKSKDL